MPQPQMPAMTNWRFEVDVERIGWLTIDTPKSPVNTPSRLSIQELETALLRIEDLIASGEVIGVVIQSGKESGFIAGADVTEFDQMSDPAVLPEALGSTTASRLLQAAERALLRAGCSRVTLDTTRPLQRAVAFYQRHGYRPTGRIRDFYGMPLFEHSKEIGPGIGKPDSGGRKQQRGGSR